MGLFDNIFLDEDATTAVAEAPEEGKEEEAPLQTQAEAIQGDSSISTPTTEVPKEFQTEATLDTTSVPEIDTGLSFDIGGDLSFDADGTLATENTSDPTTSTDTSSFMVNGVAYGSSDNENTTPESTEISSVAMVQGSTAASGINIIDEQATGIGTEGAIDTTISESTPVIPQDDSLMNIISSEPTIEETSVITPETPVINETPSIIETVPTIENIVTTPEVIESQTTDTVIADAVPSFTEDIFATTESSNKEPEVMSEVIVPELPIEEVSKKEEPSTKLDDILQRLIRELNEREQAINEIVMKKHELAKRRMKIEQEHETELLALNLEEDYLKSKAERERAEQDKLQGVIKTFQKQIALSE